MNRWLLQYLLISIAIFGSNCAPAKALAEGSEDLYKLSPGFVVDGPDNCKVSLRIDASKGYKWNKEFPYKLIIDKQEGTELSRTKFAKGDVKLADKGKTATFEMGAAGKVGPGAVVLGKVSFSLCTRKVCKIFMNKKVVWKAGEDGQKQCP